MTTEFTKDFPITTAVRHLREHQVAIEGFLFPYEEKGGTRHSAMMLNEDEHRVIKTIVLQRDDRKLLVVLMHGDLEISTKNLARQLSVKSIQPADAKVAERATGYQFGGTSPFGLKQPLPIYVEASILHLPYFWINGGKRGFLVRLTPENIQRVLPLQTISVAVEPSR